MGMSVCLISNVNLAHPYKVYNVSNFFKGVFSLVALYFTPWEVVFFKVIRGGLCSTVFLHLET